MYSLFTLTSSTLRTSTTARRLEVLAGVGEKEDFIRKTHYAWSQTEEIARVLRVWLVNLRI